MKTWYKHEYIDIPGGWSLKLKPLDSKAVGSNLQVLPILVLAPLVCVIQLICFLTPLNHLNWTEPLKSLTFPWNYFFFISFPHNPLRRAIKVSFYEAPKECQKLPFGELCLNFSPSALCTAAAGTWFLNSCHPALGFIAQAKLIWVWFFFFFFEW